MPDPTTATLARKNHRRPAKSRWAYRRSLAVPIGGTPAADFIVSGTITPDVTGEYFYDGLINGEPKYKWDSGDWWLWASVGAMFHYLNQTPGVTTGPRWVKFGGGVAGTYVPTGGASGSAIVAPP